MKFLFFRRGFLFGRRPGNCENAPHVSVTRGVNTMNDSIINELEFTIKRTPVITIEHAGDVLGAIDGDSLMSAKDSLLVMYSPITQRAAICDDVYRFAAICEFTAAGWRFITFHPLKSENYGELKNRLKDAPAYVLDDGSTLVLSGGPVKIVGVHNAPEDKHTAAAVVTVPGPSGSHHLEYTDNDWKVDYM